MKTVYIISLKFAPGLKKEFIAIGENLKKSGVRIKYIISEEYSNIEGNCNEVFYVDTKNGIKNLTFDTLKLFFDKKFMEIFSKDYPSFILFYNPHPFNPKLARMIKDKFPDALLALYLHDPYKPDKSHYGLKKSLYMNIVEFIQGLTVKYMDYIISPSEYSSYLFKKKYPEFKEKNYVAPLLIPDQKLDTNKERKYFSIVGGAHSATGHDTFIELINYVAKKNLNYKFFIISSSKISHFLKKLDNKARKFLKVMNKNLIKDSEINEVISQSYAVFRLDREVTQSGVIPVAYMNKTPVIVRDIPGLRQHVKHKQTGYIVPFDCTPEDLMIAMDFVKKNFNELSRNARKYYEEVWAEWNFKKYYGWLVELLKSQ